MLIVHFSELSNMKWVLTNLRQWRFHLENLCFIKFVQIMFSKNSFLPLFIQIMSCPVTAHLNILNLKQIPLTFWTFDLWDTNFLHCRVCLKMALNNFVCLFTFVLFFDLYSKTHWCYPFSMYSQFANDHLFS